MLINARKNRFLLFWYFTSCIQLSTTNNRQVSYSVTSQKCARCCGLLTAVVRVVMDIQHLALGDEGGGR